MGDIKKIGAVAIGLLGLMLIGSFSSVKSPEKGVFYKDMVPDSTTALAIGEVLLKKYFGAQHIERSKPIGVVLKNDSIWVVYVDFLNLPEETRVRGKGGRAHIKIRKKDCQVVGIEHAE